MPRRSRCVSSVLLLSLTAACGQAGDAARVDTILGLEGDPVAGAEVFAAHCAACHGADATGGSAPGIAGEDEAEEIVEVVLYGEDTMPAFEDTLSDPEIADVAAFVQDAG